MGILLCLSPSVATSSEKVYFNPVNFPPSAFKQRQAKARGEKLNQKPGIRIWGYLKKPAGDGPFPALVLMHGCGGTHANDNRWARFLNEAGYATLQIDSFKPRNLLNICTDPMSGASPQTRALDAFGAYLWLQDQEFIDKDRIGIVGWDQGGNAVLAAASNIGLTKKVAHRFNAAIAFYPYCFGGGDYQQPLLIFVGSKDSWAPQSRCQTLKKRSSNDGRFVRLITYADAYHYFDIHEHEKGQWGTGLNGQKFWLLYDRQSHEDAKKEIILFLRQKL